MGIAKWFASGLTVCGTGNTHRHLAAKTTRSQGIRVRIRGPTRKSTIIPWAFTNKKDDKVTISGHGVVSADGKTRTVTLTGTDSKGKKYTSTALYDKQWREPPDSACNSYALPLFPGGRA